MSRDVTSKSVNQLLLRGGITVPSYNFIPHVVAEISGAVGGVHRPMPSVPGVDVC